MDDTKFCPSCGDQVPVTTKYCDNCGYAFPKETIPQASVYTPPVMNVQPVVNNTQTVNAQPVVNNTPVVNTPPAVNDTPLVNNTPVAAVTTAPVVNSQPTVNNTPVVNAQPVINNAQETVKPVADNTPATNPEPVANAVKEEKIQPEASNNTQDTVSQPTADNAPKAATPIVDNKADNVSESSAAPIVNNSQTVVDQTVSKSAAENSNVSQAEQQPAVSQQESVSVQADVPVKNESAQVVSNNRQIVNGQVAAVSMAGMPGSQAPISQMNPQQMQGNQFGAQIPNGQVNGPKMTGPQPYGPQMNNQQPGGPVLMNPAYASSVPPEKPKGYGVIIAILVVIMVLVIIGAIVASVVLASQIEGIDEMFSSTSLGGTHSVVLSDTETVYMEVGDTHTIWVENIDEFSSPRDIDWSVANGGYYSNDVIRITDNYDGSVTVTALNPGKTSVVVSGRGVDKEGGYVIKIDVSEESLEYGNSLSGGEFSYAGTAWETEWAQYYFVSPEAKDPVIETLENDWGLSVMDSNDGCLMLSDYMSDYAYGDVTCTKVSENDLYASNYYNDIAVYVVPGAEYYWFTFVPEVEVIGNNLASGNAYDVIFLFQPEGTLAIYDSGFNMLSMAVETSDWPSYADLDRRFNYTY